MKGKKLMRMGSNLNRYPLNWEEIAMLIKKQAGWKCSKCGLQCLKPEDDTSNLTKRERTRKTLNVHHANYTPEDNRAFNLIPVCTSCHLSYHNRRQSNTTPGQLSLWKGLKIEEQTHENQPRKNCVKFGPEDLAEEKKAEKPLNGSSAEL